MSHFDTDVDDPVADEVANVEVNAASDVVEEYENLDHSITINYRDGGHEQFQTESDPSAYDDSHDQQAQQAYAERDQPQQDALDPVDEQFEQ